MRPARRINANCPGSTRTAAIRGRKCRRSGCRRRGRVHKCHECGGEMGSVRRLDGLIEPLFRDYPDLGHRHNCCFLEVRAKRRGIFSGGTLLPCCRQSQPSNHPVKGITYMSQSFLFSRVNRSVWLRGLLLSALVLTGLAFLPAADALSPLQVGGYTNQNTAVGDHALDLFSTAFNNTAVGFASLYFSNGTNNTAT